MPKLCLIALLLFPPLLFGQTDSVKFTIEPILDDIFDDKNGFDDESVGYEYIENFSLNKTEINSAGIFELLRIPYIDINTAKLIWDYRKKYGHIFTFMELYKIKNIDTSIVNNIIPFISINSLQYNLDDGNFSDGFQKQMRNRLSADIQDKSGFTENKYAGSKLRAYNKIFFRFNTNYSFSFIAEKDAGEASYTDFKTFFFDVKNIGILKKLIIGDYLLNYGQGLALGGVYSPLSSSGLQAATKRNSNEINAYSGTNENRFFRGTAVNLLATNYSFSFFYSSNKFDASIDSSSQIITSTLQTGLHRTTAEIANKNNASEKFTGFSFSFGNSHLKTGVLYYYSQLSNPLENNRNWNNPHKYFNMYSIYYDAIFNSVNLSGEAACDSKNFACMNSLAFTADKFSTFYLSIRKYPLQFYSLHSNGYSQNSCQNELGIYLGAKIKTKAGIFNIGFDQYKTSSIPALYSFPAKGSELTLNYEQKLSVINLKLRYIHSNKENASQSAEGSITKNKLRLQITDIGIGEIILKETLLYNNYKISVASAKEEGYGFIQSVTYQYKKTFSATASIALFSTESFNTAVYDNEKDMPGTLTSTALFNKGERFYLLVNYSPAQSVKISIKYSETFKPAEIYLGSGDNIISNNIDNKISFQCDFNL